MSITNPALVRLAQSAYRIRRFALRMGEVQGQGYIGQALDIADVLAVAYFDALAYRADDPHWEGRDRFLLSKGHACVAVYAALAERGFFPVEELQTYGRDFARLMNHISHQVPGVEFSTGSLGHALPFAHGLAYAFAQALRVPAADPATSSSQRPCFAEGGWWSWP